MKDNYSREELKKMGRHVSVPEGKGAVLRVDTNCDGWLIFIRDIDVGEVTRKIVSTSFNVN